MAVAYKGSVACMCLKGCWFLRGGPRRDKYVYA